MKKLPYLFLLGLFLLSFGLSFIPALNSTTFDPALAGQPQAPSMTHPLGTDDLGRDVLLRSLAGAKISLLVGITSIAISTLIGLGMGLFCGYVQGWIDTVIMRLVDMLMALPTLFLILMIQSLWKPSIWNVVAVIGFTGWMGTTRLVRAEVLSLKQRPFVLAAKARGFSTWRVVLKHVLPHALSPVIVSATLGVGYAILTESVLSFLGLGVQPPFASWGNMLERSVPMMNEAPWMSLAPGILITLTVLSLQVIGDQLRASIHQKKSTL